MGRYRRGVTRSTLEKATRRLHWCWIVRRRDGARIRVTLTARGRAFVDRAVPTRIIGVGPFVGIPAPRPDPLHWALENPSRRARRRRLPSLFVRDIDLDWCPAA